MYTHSSYSVCIQCSIDSPQVFGEVEEFSSAIQKVISGRPVLTVMSSYQCLKRTSECLGKERIS